jgi:ribosomal protein S18 acetylase RimI-like enzyme
MNGFKAMRLSVYDDNEIALKLYKKSGWTEFSRINKILTYIKTLDD